MENDVEKTIHADRFDFTHMGLKSQNSYQTKVDR